MSNSDKLKLGLIGDNIARSRSPLLHRLAGRQHGIEVTYDRLIPIELNLSFDDVFDRCAAQGYRGINITYPYKERVVERVTIDDPLVRAMGAVNTVIFGADGPKGFNTDCSGFAAAYRGARGERAPGVVLMIGAGGVGRAIAFALVGLGIRELRVLDSVAGKADGMADAIRRYAPDIDVSSCTDVAEAASGVAGIINCTPVGMVGYEGTPLAREYMAGAEWAFDAVYTPFDTAFLGSALAQGLSVVSGWELFFWQGVHAWRHFSGSGLDERQLRAALLGAGEEDETPTAHA